jgi:hypothetical protein
MPWQLRQPRAWKIESPVATMAAVTPAGSPPAVLVVERVVVAVALVDVETVEGVVVAEPL